MRDLEVLPELDGMAPAKPQTISKRFLRSGFLHVFLHICLGVPVSIPRLKAPGDAAKYAVSASNHYSEQVHPLQVATSAPGFSPPSHSGTHLADLCALQAITHIGDTEGQPAALVPRCHAKHSKV